MLARVKQQGGQHPTDHPLAGYDFCDILIFIHGYNNSIADIMHRHDLLQKRLREKGFKGVIVSFDWPSANSAINYLEDRSDAKATADRLVTDGIAILAKNQAQEDRNKCDIDVHLLCHSTGAHVAREAFYAASKKRSISRINWNVSQIAFIGGDISRAALSSDDKKSKHLCAHATRITNYQNPQDSALKLSNIKRVGLAPRVGRVGIPDDSPDMVVNVNVESHWSSLKKDDSDAEGNWSHSWHFDYETFAHDLVYTIEGDLDRHSIPTRTSINGKLVLTKITN